MDPKRSSHIASIPEKDMIIFELYMWDEDDRSDSGFH